MDGLQQVATSCADIMPAIDDDVFWQEFHHATQVVDGVRLHYVEGGEGRPVLLVPGWPQNWYAWRMIMPQLKREGFRVVAVDPKGYGDSSCPLSGYDTGTVARELHLFAEQIGLLSSGGLHLVGHDIGTWISFAYAADWPSDLRSVTLLDGAIPGLTSMQAKGKVPTSEENIGSWQFSFNRLPDLPEVLFAGREKELLTWLFREKSVRPWALTESAVSEYVRITAVPGAIRSALNYYREAFSPESLRSSEARAQAGLTIPVMAFGAEAGVNDKLYTALRSAAEDLRGGIFMNCGHYMPEEAPRALLRELLAFFRAVEPVQAASQS